MTPGALVLDSEGLSRAVAEDPLVMARIDHAKTHGARVVISTLTLIEAMNPQQPQPRWDFVVSRLNVEEVTRQLTHRAMALLRAAGLHGHKYAIDAVVAATAMAQPGPVRLLTSDVDDMAKLCDKRIMLIPV
ncbi:DNA-binding protein [Streptomyces sp. CB01881]|nr:DNA-binding protein [Streptomyces sp. CB01881]TYC77916.1 DNA-binding protein [Streptomyces sp. CB01881]